MGEGVAQAKASKQAPEAGTEERRIAYVQKQQMHHYLEEYVPPGLWRIRDMRLSMVLGIGLYAAAIALFAYLSWSGYQSALGTQYLALDRTAGTCATVKLTNSLAVRLDLNGNFETSNAFHTTDSLFVVTFTDYIADSDSWTTDMATLKTVLQTELDLLAGLSNLPLKILHLSSWRSTFNAANGGTVKVWFDADPADLFDFVQPVLNVAIGDQGAGCQNTGWSFLNGIYNVEFSDVYQLPANPSQGGGSLRWGCSSTPIDVLGYDLNFKQQNFNLKVDVRTAITIASRQAGVMETRDLGLVDSAVHYLDGRPNDNYSIKYDLKFPEMTPLYEDTSQGPANAAWYLRFGGNLFTAAFSGYAYEPQAGAAAADCPAKCGASGNSCGTPDYLLRFTKLHGSQTDIMLRPGTNMEYFINRYKFVPGDIGCAGNYGNLKLGASFTSNIATHPFNLQQVFYTCYPFWYTAALQAVGVANANAQLAVTIAVAVLIAVLGVLRCLRPKPSLTVGEYEGRMLGLQLYDAIKLTKESEEFGLEEPDLPESDLAVLRSLERALARVRPASLATPARSPAPSSAAASASDRDFATKLGKTI
jgi:hypothetical protein